MTGQAFVDGYCLLGYSIFIQNWGARHVIKLRVENVRIDEERIEIRLKLCLLKSKQEYKYPCFTTRSLLCFTSLLSIEDEYQKVIYIMRTMNNI